MQSAGGAGQHSAAGAGASSSSGWTGSASPVEEDAAFWEKCERCGKIFRTEEQLKGHRAGAHGRHENRRDTPMHDDGPHDEGGSAPALDPELQNDFNKMRVQRLGRLRYGPGGHMGNADVDRVEQYAADVVTSIRGRADHAFASMTPAQLTHESVSAVLNPLFDQACAPLGHNAEKAQRVAQLEKVNARCKPIPRRISPPDAETTDYVYDFPFDATIQRACRMNPDFRTDVLHSTQLGSGAQPTKATFPIDDIQSGSVYSNHVLAGRRRCGQYECTICTMFYLDGVGVNNPIGVYRNEHKLVLCYYIVVELKPDHRLALHNIQPATLALQEHFNNYPTSRIVYGFPDEPADSSSFGVSMIRLGTVGIPLTVPHPLKLGTDIEIRAFGACIGIVADAPARANALGFNEGFGPNTVSPCMGCNYCQQFGHDGIADPHKRPHTFLPQFTQAGTQKWQLHTDSALRDKCRAFKAMGVGDRKDNMIRTGLKHLEHGFAQVLNFERTWAPFGIMHVEYEGNCKCHVAGFVYCMVRVHKWCTLDEINRRMKAVLKGSDCPPSFRHDAEEGTDALTPHTDASISWTAAQVRKFMLHAVEILIGGSEPLVKDCSKASWICFELHCQYFQLLHLLSYSRDDIIKLDRLIYKQQEMFLKIPQYDGLWKLKNHFATHLPVDILRFGPPTYWSEMKFEMKNQWFKQRARLSNFISLLRTLAYDTEMRMGLDLFEGVLLTFLVESRSS